MTLQHRWFWCKIDTLFSNFHVLMNAYQSAMKIIVNEKPLEVAEGLSAAGLIELLDLSGQRLALEVNEEIVPRSTFATHRLQTGDRVEVIHAIGGG